jgi:hypothetical protein
LVSVAKEVLTIYRPAGGVRSAGDFSYTSQRRQTARTPQPIKILIISSLYFISLIERCPMPNFNQFPFSPISFYLLHSICQRLSNFPMEAVRKFPTAAA